MKIFCNNSPRLIICEPDEEIMNSLLAAAKSLNLKSAFFFGVGAIKNVELGFYNLSQKTYERRKFDENFEMLSFSANLSTKEKAPFLHAHVVLGKPDFTTIGGHLFAGTISVTAEIFAHHLENEFVREFDNRVGLSVISREF